MTNCDFPTSTNFEDKQCSPLGARGFVLDSISETCFEDPRNVVLQNFRKVPFFAASIANGVLQCTRNLESSEKMQARECTRVARETHTPRFMIFNEDKTAKTDTGNSERGLLLPVGPIQTTSQKMSSGKRSRQEMASENAFSSEGSNKTASGDNPKASGSRRLDVESFASFMGSQQPCVVSEAQITLGTEETSAQARQGTSDKAQTDWETHIAAMEQVLTTNRAQGLPTGPISEEALDLLSQMVSKLYELNGKVLYVKMQDVMDTHRRNTERIENVFHGLAGVKKARGLSRNATP